MILESNADVTPAVLAEIGRADDPRLREIMTSLVRHLHAFVRETRLSEAEFQQACGFINRIGQKSSDSHNEAVMMAGSLGLSTLVCLLNNGDNGQTETTANLLGPFWRLDHPRVENGGSLIRSPTPGTPMFVEVFVKDAAGQPVAGADVDVWHCNEEGYYENQDTTQANFNLRGKLTTDEHGRIHFRSIMPTGYPIPPDGPTGDLLRVLKRHNLRPAHLHFIVVKPGYKAHIAQVYWNHDPNIETDCQFGVTRALLGDYVRHESGTPPAPDVDGPWITMTHTLVVEPGQPKLPPPPIKDKAQGPRPEIERLVRA